MERPKKSYKALFVFIPFHTLMIKKDPQKTLSLYNQHRIGRVQHRSRHEIKLFRGCIFNKDNKNGPVIMILEYFHAIFVFFYSLW